MLILTPHFTWDEVTHSDKAIALGIENVVPLELYKAIKNTAQNMERVRYYLDTPIHVDSWYRCLALNRALRSRDTSQHLKGEAVDFTSPEFGSPYMIAKALAESDIEFDQLILEHTWVHISFQSNPNIAPRKQVLTLIPTTGHYANGLTDKEGNKLS